MLDVLLHADKGMSRLELRAELSKNEKFRAQLDRNINAFYNNVMRYIRSDKIVEVNALLYHADRAPLRGASLLPEAPTLRVLSPSDGANQLPCQMGHQSNWHYHAE